MENNQETRKIEIGPDALKNLNATWKWAMFLSVLGFIFFGLLVGIGLVTSTFLSAFKTRQVNLGIPETLMILIFIITAVVYFFPVFFLFRFSRNIRDAIQDTNTRKFERAFRNLRMYFAYIGILIIVALLVYFIALIAAGATMSFLKGG
ncbi:MAG: DUF5362 family protein [Bacteroidales bacterium]